MTFEEAQELCLDVMLEYLPKNITKAVKAEVAAEILNELVDLGALKLEDGPDEDEAPSADEEDLVELMRGG